MKVIPVIEVNSWDGAGGHRFAFYLNNSDGLGTHTAREWASKNPHDYLRETEIVLFDTVADYNEFKSSKVRERALAKLTAEERKALGF